MSAGVSPWARVSLAALVSLGLFATGCVAGVDAGYVSTYPTYTVEVDPLWIATYPQYSYRGTSVYWVGNRWVYQTPGGWVAFREEPTELRRYRTYYAPAPRYYAPSPRYYGPAPRAYPSAPGYRPPPPRYTSPPVRPPTQLPYERGRRYIPRP